MFQSTLCTSIQSTLLKKTSNFLNSFFLDLSIFTRSNNIIVDFRIRFKGLFSENSSYVQMSCLRSMDWVAMDAEISILPHKVDRDSVSEMYCLFNPLFSCTDMPLINIDE